MGDPVRIAFHPRAAPGSPAPAVDAAAPGHDADLTASDQEAGLRLYPVQAGSDIEGAALDGDVALLGILIVGGLQAVSTGVVAASTGDQGQADKKGSTLTTIFKHDWLYWGMTGLFKKQFMGLMGATDAVIVELTPGQQELVDRIIEEMNPVSLRSAGVVFDNRATLPGDRIAAIQAPTLIFHAADDTLQPYHNAEFAAATIPGARLVRFERGGHLLMAVEQATIRAAVQKHILDHASK